MGVLDDLKREAEAVKAQREEQQLSAEAVRELAIKTVQPRVQKLFKYFKEFQAQLEVVATENLRRTYEHPATPGQAQK